MDSSLDPDLTPDSLGGYPFFLARQPILDRSQSLVAYELLFRNAEVGTSDINENLSGTAAAIAHTSHIGIEKIVGDALCFVNVDAEVMMSDILNSLPRDQVILELVDTMAVTPEIIERISVLVREGFRVALDNVTVDSDVVQKLLPLVEIVKFDLSEMTLSALQKLTTQFKSAGKKILAEKVETTEQFKICLDLGFDYFQGYYFARPVIMTGRKLSPSQIAVMRILSLITSDADNKEIEDTIKRNVTLGLNLLRLVNTPASGIRQRIDSLSQALVVLGRDQLRRWLQIMLYAEPNKKSNALTPLLTLAATRGRLLELIAGKIEPGKRKIADTAFTVGIMSLMDTLFGFPMHQILEEINVVDEVSEALLHHHGYYGDLLMMAEHLERINEDGHMLPPMLQRRGLSSVDLNQMAVAAFEWSNNISRNAG